MLLKRVVLVVGLVMALVPLSAFADSLDFSFGGGALQSDSGAFLTTQTDLLTGEGSSSSLDSVTWLSSVFGLTTFTPSSGPTFGSVDITTGLQTSAGSLDNGGTLAPGGQITVTSNGDNTWGPVGVGVPNTILFSGAFSGPTSWTYDPISNQYTLFGDISLTPGYATGNPNFPTFDSMWPYMSPTGYLDLTGYFGGGNSWFNITSGTIYLPEPATLSLVGFGLIGLAGFGRKRLLG